MKYISVLPSTFVLAAVLASATTSEAAVDRTRFRGNSADFSSFDETAITCDDGSPGFVQSSISLQAFAQGVRSTFGDSDSETVFVFFSEFNSCTGQFVDAFVFDDAPEFDQSGVDSASVVGDYELVSFDGTELGTLSIDLDFTGTGDTSRQNSHSVTQTGDFLFNSHSSGTFRQATVAGTLALDGEAISTSNGFAQLTNTRSGDITVTH